MKLTIDSPELETSMIRCYETEDIPEFVKYCNKYMKDTKHQPMEICECVKHLMVKYYYIHLFDKNRNKTLMINKED